MVSKTGENWSTERKVLTVCLWFVCAKWHKKPKRFQALGPSSSKAIPVQYMDGLKLVGIQQVKRAACTTCIELVQLFQILLLRFKEMQLLYFMQTITVVQRVSSGKCANLAI